METVKCIDNDLYKVLSILLWPVIHIIINTFHSFHDMWT